MSLHTTPADDRTGMLHEATAAAAALFCESPRRRAALTYLHQRGIDARALGTEWIVGYAPPGWTRLVDRLSPDFDDQVLIDAGLARRSSRGTLIDTFRERVMFGIRNHDTVAGFIGRDLSGSPTAPRYLNTPRTPIFDKSSLLFGLAESASADPDAQPVLVEGPLDVLAIAARTHEGDGRPLVPITASGTAFTPRHAQALAGAFGERRITVAMDGDAPGRRAGIAAADLLHQHGLHVRIALLPPGCDPADQLSRPNATLDDFRYENALTLIDVHLETAIAQRGDEVQWPEGRLSALREVAKHLSTYSPADAGRSIGRLAATLDLDPGTVSREVAAAFVERTVVCAPRL